MHLDEPFYVEFGYFVWKFVRGDENGWPGLGYSYSGFVPSRIRSPSGRRERSG